MGTIQPGSPPFPLAQWCKRALWSTVHDGPMGKVEKKRSGSLDRNMNAGISEGTGLTCPACGAEVIRIAVKGGDELCDPTPVRYRDLEWQGIMIDAAGNGYWKCDGATEGLNEVVGYRLHGATCPRSGDFLFNDAES